MLEAAHLEQRVLRGLIRTISSSKMAPELNQIRGSIASQELSLGADFPQRALSDTAGVPIPLLAQLDLDAQPVGRQQAWGRLASPTRPRRPAKRPLRDSSAGPGAAHQTTGPYPGPQEGACALPSPRSER